VRAHALALGAALAHFALLNPGAFAQQVSNAPDLQAEALAILDKHCKNCHGPTSKSEKAKAEIPDILAIEDVIKRGQIVPGEPDKSELYTQVRDDKMPDGAALHVIDSKNPAPVPDAEKEVLKRWIVALAGDPDAVLAERTFISDGDILGYIFDDVAKVTPTRAREHRYFTLTHLYNNPTVTDEEMDTYRQALAKMVNSLTWNRVHVKPEPVDPAKTILRVNIVQLGWSPEKWDRLVAANPYNKFYDTVAAQALADAVGVPMPYIRADWFVAKVSRPPLYHEFADIPATAAELERKLLFNGLTADENLERSPYEVVRGGVREPDSGVSNQNRMVERHFALYGAYWRSFDFRAADPADPQGKRRNFFRFPTGPGGEDGFLHDGGEIIFNLPNGFQGYMLVDAEGKRLDGPAPTEIVKDETARDPAIINGLSCISCHSEGMKEPPLGLDRLNDLVKHVRRGGFQPRVLEAVETLHRPDDLASAIADDKKRFLDALARVGVTKTSVSDEPVSAVVGRFENVKVDVRAAAAELGLTEEAFRLALDTRIDREPGLEGIKAQLEEGGLPRNDFIAAFDALRAALSIGKTDANLPTRGKLQEELAALGQVQEENAKLKGQLQALDQQTTNVLALAEQIECGITNDAQEMGEFFTYRGKQGRIYNRSGEMCHFRYAGPGPDFIEPCSNFAVSTPNPVCDQAKAKLIAAIRQFRLGGQ